MTVKSKTAPAQDSAIESALAQNVALAVALAAAEEKANLLSIEVDTFDLEMDSITDAWNTGDDTVTAEAYSLAQIEFKRATSLYEAAQKSVTNLGRSFINTDKDLAELVAGWVEAANPGVPVTASIAMSGTPSALPAIYVVQSGKTEVRGGGVIAGRVGITYFRNPLHREFNPATLEHQASLAGCQISAGGSTGATSGDGVTSDRAVVTVHHAHTANPVLGEPTKAFADQLAQNLATALARATTTPDSRLEMIEGGAIVSDVVTVKPQGGTIVGSETDETGSRRTEVEVRLTWWRHGAREMSGSMDRKLQSMVESYVETFTSGLGVCQSAKTAGINSPDHSGLTNVVVLLTFASASR